MKKETKYLFEVVTVVGIKNTEHGPYANCKNCDKILYRDKLDYEVRGKAQGWQPYLPVCSELCADMLILKSI